MRVCVCMHMCMYINICAWIYLCMYMCTCKDTLPRRVRNTYIHTYVHACIASISSQSKATRTEYIDTFIHTYIHTLQVRHPNRKRCVRKSLQEIDCSSWCLLICTYSSRTENLNLCLIYGCFSTLWICMFRHYNIMLMYVYICKICTVPLLHYVDAYKSPGKNKITIKSYQKKINTL